LRSSGQRKKDQDQKPSEGNWAAVGKKTCAEGNAGPAQPRHQRVKAQQRTPGGVEKEKEGEMPSPAGWKTTEEDGGSTQGGKDGGVGPEKVKERENSPNSRKKINTKTTRKNLRQPSPFASSS